MARRGYSRDNNNVERFLAGILTLAIVVLVWYFITDPAKAISYLVAVLIIAVAFILLMKWLERRHFNNLLNKLRNAGQEEFLKNFINSFGLEGKKGEGYSFRNHKFEWDRINDLQKILREKGVTSSKKDVFALLRFYVQEKEEKFTREMSSKEPRKLSSLTGPDFEKLLYRLLEGMGYSVQLIGGAGDQGGDLIAAKEGERVLIQAKCYRDWSTGNAAVQQVVGAMSHYNCNRTMVVTTSHFTPEAITLAKDNRTDLISKEQLQGLLLKYLGESWI